MDRAEKFQSNAERSGDRRDQIATIIARELSLYAKAGIKLNYIDLPEDIMSTLELKLVRRNLLMPGESIEEAYPRIIVEAQASLQNEINQNTMPLPKHSLPE
jgi:hypothetical protein